MPYFAVFEYREGYRYGNRYMSSHKDEGDIRKIEQELEGKVLVASGLTESEARSLVDQTPIECRINEIWGDSYSSVQGTIDMDRFFMKFRELMLYVNETHPEHIPVAVQYVRRLGQTYGLIAAHMIFHYLRPNGNPGDIGPSIE